MPLTIEEFDARIAKALGAVANYPDLHARGQQLVIVATVAGLRFLAEVLLELRDQVVETNRFTKDYIQRMEEDNGDSQA